jgi:type IV pilus assembly protein PilA
MIKLNLLIKGKRDGLIRKKGFTLIELIAVIAILAILGMILVPKIAGYKAKANKSNLQTSARTILDAVKAHNADAVGDTTDSGGPVVDTDTVEKASSKINDGLATPIIATDSTDSNSSFNKLKGITVGQLATVASGSFSLDNEGKIVTTGLATGSIE